MESRRRRKSECIHDLKQLMDKIKEPERLLRPVEQQILKHRLKGMTQRQNCPNDGLRPTSSLCPRTTQF